MSYIDAVNAGGGDAVATIPTHLHHISYLQGHPILIDLHPVPPSWPHWIIKECFFLQDLGPNLADVTDVFMVLSMQLLHINLPPPIPAGYPGQAPGGHPLS
jgi:hypothetical protein